MNMQLYLGNKRAHNGLNVFTVQNRVAGPVFPFFFRKLYCALRNGGARKASASFTLSLWGMGVGVVVAYCTINVAFN